MGNAYSMKNTLIRWILVISCVASFTASGESVDQAEMELLRLEKQSLANENDLVKMDSELPELQEALALANEALAHKQKDLTVAGSVMQKAIADHYENPNPDNEREAKRLSREFTLAEISVRRQQLEVERAERDISEVIAKIDALKQQRAAKIAAIDRQNQRLASIKAQAAKKKKTKREV